MIKRLIWTIWTPMSSVLKKADKLNLSLSLSVVWTLFYKEPEPNCTWNYIMACIFLCLKRSWYRCTLALSEGSYVRSEYSDLQIHVMAPSRCQGIIKYPVAMFMTSVPCIILQSLCFMLLLLNRLWVRNLSKLDEHEPICCGLVADWPYHSCNRQWTSFQLWVLREHFPWIIFVLTHWPLGDFKQILGK